MSDTADNASRRRYEGRGIGALKATGPRSTVRLPGAEAATLLPEPHKVHLALLEPFFAINGPAPNTLPQDREPALRPRDITVIANFMTLALRNDLPGLDRYDAAVIWEKWRQGVAAIRERMRVADRERHAPRASDELLQRTWVVREDLMASIATPGVVAERYCPWKADFFTHQRLYPEAV